MFSLVQTHKFLGSVMLMGVVLAVGCNYAGEDTTREKDFAVSKTVKTAIGASGSTFVNPIMTRWISAFQQAHPGVLINYRPIGSGAGLEELKQGLLEFAASDSPLTDEQMKDMAPVIQLPVTAGPVCAVYNVPDVKGSLRLSGATLAGIFSGNIISWQDAAIAHDNPGVKLPKAAIIVVHRSDGSGTTNILTTYLSKVNPQWSEKIGHGLTVPWPVGIGAEGSKGVLDFVQKNPGTIGYGELNYAVEKKVLVASIENRAGMFVAPSPAGATAAIEAYEEALENDPRTVIVDPPATAKNAYPITGLSFLMVPKDGRDEEERRELRGFVEYTLSGGQGLAGELNYAALPQALQKSAAATLRGMTANGQAVK
jgi:phosphate transport system substrate-binding protein